MPEFRLQGQGRAEEFLYEGRTFRKQRVLSLVQLPPLSRLTSHLRKSDTEQTVRVALTNRKFNMFTNKRIVLITPMLPAQQVPDVV